MKRLAFAVVLLAVTPALAFEQPVTPVISQAAESSHVLKAAPGALISVYGSVPAAAASINFLMVFNATSVPSNGAVVPQDCVAFPATSATNGATATIAFPLNPENFTVGITAAISSGANCFTLTATSGFFNARVQ